MSLRTPESVQKLQTALHAKAKETPTYRFYALAHAWRLAKANGGAAGVDGQTFQDIEEYGVERWLGELAEDLRKKTYRSQPMRRVYIPKPDGRTRPLGISHKMSTAAVWATREIASQHKSQFVANMSHELRTPLAAILGYAELIQEGFYEPQGPKSLDALGRIRSNGKHLLGLINTVLDIAKIEAGQFKLNLAECALENVVETVRAATEALAENKKLGLKTDAARSLPIGLGDEQRLTQVLLNLVGNAIKFTDVGEVRITAGAENDQFAITVADTGPGIPFEEQTRIFEQFHQVDSSNTKAKGGTGLGLAIAKQIIELHAGRIWVESALGKGARFQLRLPIRPETLRGAA